MRWTKTWTSSALIACVAGFSCSCTSLASGTDTAEPEPDPAWSCLGEPNKPLPSFADATGAAPPFAVFAVPIFDFTVPLARIPSLKVQACLVGDADCKMEVGMVFGPMDTKIPAGTGGNLVVAPVYSIGMQYDTNAYIRMTAPGYLQTEYFLGGPLIGAPDGATQNGAPIVNAELPLVKGYPLTPIKAVDADNLATYAGIVRDPDTAIIGIRTVDCSGRPASGVKLQLELPGPGDALAFSYLSGQVSTDPNRSTDEKGLAGFANVPLSTPFVNAIVEGIAPNGMHYGTINITIRKGGFTGAEVRPDTGQYGR